MACWMLCGAGWVGCHLVSYERRHHSHPRLYPQWPWNIYNGNGSPEVTTAVSQCVWIGTGSHYSGDYLRVQSEMFLNILNIQWNIYVISYDFYVRIKIIIIIIYHTLDTFLFITFSSFHSPCWLKYNTKLSVLKWKHIIRSYVCYY